MRVALLVSFFAGLSAVNALPKHGNGNGNSDCTCLEKVQSTTTIYDKTKTIKAGTVTETTTLDPVTKTKQVVTTTTSPYTATYHALTSETLTSTSTVTEIAWPFVNNNAKMCNCPTTSTTTQLKTQHGTITVLIPKTKIANVTPAPTTVTSTKVKSVKSAVATEIVVSTKYFSANATATTTTTAHGAPWAWGNGTWTSTMTGTGGVVIVTGS